MCCTTIPSMLLPDQSELYVCQNIMFQDSIINCTLLNKYLELHIQLGMLVTQGPKKLFHIVSILCWYYPNLGLFEILIWGSLVMTSGHASIILFLHLYRIFFFRRLYRCFWFALERKSILACHLWH